jgi:hypothetical protein
VNQSNSIKKFSFLHVLNKTQYIGREEGLHKQDLRVKKLHTNKHIKLVLCVCVNKKKDNLKLSFFIHKFACLNYIF